MATDRNILRAIYSKFERELFFGDPLATREFVTLANPGILMDPESDEGDLKNLADQTDVLDVALDSQWLYRPLGARVSEIWWDVVGNAVLPRKALTREQEREIAALHRFLVRHGPRYERYSDEYQLAESEYRRLVESASSSESEINQARRARERALQRWQTLGRKAAYERAQARVELLVRP